MVHGFNGMKTEKKKFKGFIKMAKKVVFGLTGIKKEENEKIIDTKMAYVMVIILFGAQMGLNLVRGSIEMVKETVFTLLTA